MLFLWIVLAILLGAAVLLPLYILFAALSRRSRRAASNMHTARFMRPARGY